MKPEVSQILLQKYAKKNPPILQAGDTVRVHQKIREGDKERIQVFEGLVIATKHGNGLDGTFTVRKIAVGSIGVERVFPVHSPNIVKVERMKTAQVRRAKLYFMRDRKGKSARFKSESPNPYVWEEPVAVEAPAAVEAEEATAETVTKEVKPVKEETEAIEEKAEEAQPEEEKSEEPVVTEEEKES